MGIRAILETIRDGLRTDAELIEYTQAKYTKNPTIYLGVDLEAMPPQSTFPVVAIAAVDSVEVTTSRRRWRIRLGINIENSTIDTATANQVTYEGFVEAEEFREEVEFAILRLSNSLGKLEIQGQTIEETLFENWASEVSFFVEQYRTSRRPDK